MTRFKQEYPTQSTLLQKLINLKNLIESKSIYKAMDLVNVQEMISNLNECGYVIKEDMKRANDLWRKYQ